MSWLFGRKKHHRESPPDTSEEAGPSQPDDYIIIEKEDNPLFSNSQRSSGLYPNLGNEATGIPSYPPAAVLPQQVFAGDSQNYLLGISCKLSKSLHNDFEIDRLQIDEIMSFVLNVQNEEYTYDFSLERSVINEMESGAE